jgi:hypothetical protein
MKDEGEEIGAKSELDFEDLKSSAITAKQLDIEGEDIESSIHDKPPQFPPSEKTQVGLQDFELLKVIFLSSQESLGFRKRRVRESHACKL